MRSKALLSFLGIVVTIALVLWVCRPVFSERGAMPLDFNSKQLGIQENHSPGMPWYAQVPSNQFKSQKLQQQRRMLENSMGTCLLICSREFGGLLHVDLLLQIVSHCYCCCATGQSLRVCLSNPEALSGSNPTSRQSLATE